MSSVSGLEQSQPRPSPQTGLRRRLARPTATGHASATPRAGSAGPGSTKTQRQTGQTPPLRRLRILRDLGVWNGLHLGFGCRDTVNAAAWKAGYTGTMLKHGKRVEHLENALVGDCVIYGGGTGKHVALVIGKRNGRLMVISHGSQPGPYYLPYDYRSDINQIRQVHR